MAISVFFVISMLLLYLFNPGELAIVWNSFGSWRFIANLLTHMFGHADFRHLMGNYVFVFPYALYLETKIGWRSFCKWWLFTGFSALALNIVVMLLGQPQMGVIGSSGAAFGIVAAGLWMVNEHRWAKYVCRALVFYFIYKQGLNAFDAFVMPSFFGGIAYAAHLGGILGGIYLAQRQLRLLSKQSASQDASSK